MGPSPAFFFFKLGKCKKLIFSFNLVEGITCVHVVCMMLSKSGKGSVGGGEAGEKAKTTPDKPIPLSIAFPKRT